MCNLLQDKRKHIEEQGLASGHSAAEQLVAEMNALEVRDAEEYYGTTMTEDAVSWDLRDEHCARSVRSRSHRMTETGRPRLSCGRKTHTFAMPGRRARVAERVSVVVILGSRR